MGVLCKVFVDIFEAVICNTRQKCAVAPQGKCEDVLCMDHVSALTPPLGDKEDFGGGDAGMSHEEKRREVESVRGQ